MNLTPSPAFFPSSLPAPSSSLPLPSHSNPLPPAITSNPHLIQNHQSHDDLLRRWSGWDTTTLVVTVTAYPPQATGTVTVVTTIGEPAPPGTGTITVTQTVVDGGDDNSSQTGPQTVTITELYPGLCSAYLTGGTCTQTTTVSATRSTTTLYVGTSVPDAQPTTVHHRQCLPGDASEKVPGTLSPTKTQTGTLYAIGLYFVIILIGWNLFAIRHILYPFKIVVVAYHEFGHIVCAAVSGARVESVSIDPNEGGQTQLESGVWPLIAVFAGYPSSILIGGALVFAGFNTLASKIASAIIFLSYFVVFWWVNGIITQLFTVAAAGLLVGLWFIDHAGVLRYYVLFVGVMSSFYIVWDIMDDFVFRKVNPCCVVQFSTRIPRVHPGVFAVVWLVLSIFVFIAWVLAAIATWRQTSHAMFCQSQSFLPT